jgi:hypothetical protein
MATISNGESGSSVRTKLNEIINKVEGVTSIDNDIDITGTLTSDGLTVEQSGNDVSIVSRNTSNNASVATSSSLKLGITSTVGTHDSEIKVVENAVNSNTTRMEFYNYFGGTLYKNMSILGNGGISFYENTGTTAKFFWDASAESLTLGASSEPSVAAGELNLVGASTTNNTAQASLSFFDGGSNDLATVKSYRGGSFSDGELAFEVAQGGAAPAEAMRIDSSGHLLVGTTNTSPATNNVDGAVLRNEGHINVSRSGGVVGYFNRGTSDGTILDLRKDGSTVGSIGTKSGLLFIETGDAGLTFDNSNNRIFPSNDGSASDNNLDLGHSSARFKDLYATNGTIQTSDRNEKQDIAELTDAEQRVAVAAKGLLRKFRWRNAVEEKGDEARTHFGIIAQDLQAAFAAEGLDAGDYAMFIHTTWTDEETGEEKSRMGVRYSELLAFIIAAI